MPLPVPRGPISRALVDHLTSPTPDPGVILASVDDLPAQILHDEDVQISLAMLYELHLRGIVGVDDSAEWDPDLIRARAVIERRLAADLEALIGPVEDPGDVATELFRLGAHDGGPPLSAHLAFNGSIDQFREWVIHRSLNQLRESDVHTFGIPRLHGAPKAGLIEVQIDEYGNGHVDYMHATLWATMMRGIGLDSDYAAYIDQIPAPSLAVVNTLSYLGLHRGLVRELMGHLCMVETTSALPCRAYSRGLRRLGFGSDVRRFFDEHVEADSVHEQLVIRRVAVPLGDSPAARIALIRGARICAAVENIAADHIWQSWERGTTSLRPVTR
ncbi:hypothetical protein ACH46_10700 [Gordonia phthalatica]|uniref:Iron-containing redox enzyme family protein n=2 Tax=Gordonia phthalatica TaxID=1136941 RepID=A0A0N9NBG5_9ACTN|nr:iron-containing redox enzyme family protein [Gordonia phthalatica]ALG84882.1 hypothetical protein ACH46_10700 [Gordonia phthalatica]